MEFLLFLIEPLEYEFFRHGLLAGLMVGSLCGLIGVYVILRGMSYVGHGLSHAAFGGAVVGFTLNLNFYAGAGAMGLLAAVFINQITKNNKIKPDAAIGIVTTAMFALGVAIVSKSRSFNQSFEAALFGNILGITDQDLVVIGLVTVATMISMFFMYRPLLFSTFDNEAARIFGIKTGACSIGVFDPPYAFDHRFHECSRRYHDCRHAYRARNDGPNDDGQLQPHADLFYCIGAVTGVAGMYLSYIFNAASGATIVLFGALLFCLAAFYKLIQEKRMMRTTLHRHGNLIHSHPHDLVHVMQDPVQDNSVPHPEQAGQKVG